MKCDVVIAGASIASLYLARELSKHKLHVVVIDQSKIPGEPNFSTAGTPFSTVKKFSLPIGGIATTIHRGGFGTRSDEYFLNFTHDIGYTLDFRKTKQLLAHEAIQEGASVLWGVKALATKKNDQSCTIKTTVGDMSSSYAIDGTGSSRALFPPTEANKKTNPTVGLEVIVRDNKILLSKFKYAMFFYFDVQMAPFGYAWVFDNGKNTYKVGVCEASVQAQRNLPSLDTRLFSFLQYLIGQKEVEIVEKHAGTIVFLKNVPYSTNRILAIGDAAGTINPLLGEGIRHSLYSALFAYESILDNLSKKTPLTRYDQKVRDYKNLNWRLFGFIHKALYGRNTRNTQEFYVQLVKFTRYMSQADALAFFADYSFLPIIKHFPHNISLLRSFVRTLA